jgi:hypothetical protein
MIVDSGRSPEHSDLGNVTIKVTSVTDGRLSWEIPSPISPCCVKWKQDCTGEEAALIRAEVV